MPKNRDKRRLDKNESVNSVLLEAYTVVMDRVKQHKGRSNRVETKKRARWRARDKGDARLREHTRADGRAGRSTRSRAVRTTFHHRTTAACRYCLGGGLCRQPFLPHAPTMASSLARPGINDSLSLCVGANQSTRPAPIIHSLPCAAVIPVPGGAHAGGRPRPLSRPPTGPRCHSPGGTEVWRPHVVSGKSKARRGAGKGRRVAARRGGARIASGTT
ncbi:hypothetical protein VFPFJ_05270 [Purpureocillium lilacinum]|uniref:Uncharacterized protein n=1 Tax=Purpureocillium lilacinum TaxID=33203 RepID=A0A179HNI9_PURLI|nr:hypothetical protein VFPFJ_05270 [Purpureocillium lilacinum]OAQ91111.1 hypothetical protein VFPFJ_05270 [Purpureocillium lilacinum]